MPPLALALVLLSATLHATWNLLIARSRDTDVTTAVAVPIGALIFLPFALPTWRIEPEAWPFLITSMVLELVYLALLAAAYGRADLSLIYPARPRPGAGHRAHLRDGRARSSRTRPARSSASWRSGPG